MFLKKSLFFTFSVAIFTVSAHVHANSGDYDSLLLEAEAGNAEAQYQIGLLGYEDQHKWLLKSAKQGHLKAQYELFSCECLLLPIDDATYEEQLKKTITESFKWLLKSAEGGYSKAQNEIAGIYDAFGGNPEAFNIDVDYSKALYWHKKAADNGDVNSQIRLGEIHADYYDDAKLYNVNKNIDEAIKWYKRASEKGDKYAQGGLGDLYYHEKQDYKNAAKWYLSAAQQGHLYSQYAMGVQYAFGKGVLQDDRESYAWYKKAIENAESRYSFNKKWVANAHHNIGVKHSNGKGVKKSAKEAARHYLAAAKLGRAGSQFLMGHYYSVGEGVLQDYKKAYMWFNIARFNEHDADIALHIEEIERRMSGEDISEAQEMSKVCLESKYKDCD